MSTSTRSAISLAFLPASARPPQRSARRRTARHRAPVPAGRSARNELVQHRPDRLHRRHISGGENHRALWAPHADDAPGSDRASHEADPARRGQVAGEPAMTHTSVGLLKPPDGAPTQPRLLLLCIAGHASACLAISQRRRAKTRRVLSAIISVSAQISPPSAAARAAPCRPAGRVVSRARLIKSDHVDEEAHALGAWTILS